ncbi:MAG: transposase [Alphaproteobacteria bacterium 65-37]|nr:transposase [Alphaproteobacteria bacterium]OJU36525.1 MAG: transposase [Alphaproteobacteria bacterium 65-37]
MNFIALDFETANADLSSICQVGLVAFRDGKVVDTYTTLVDPDDYFDPMNVSIHGIDEDRVRGAPRFLDVHPKLSSLVAGAVVVCHTLFDRAAMQQASAKYRLTDVTCRWLDTSRVARRAWSKYAKAGYGLGNLTREFGISFSHHDAAEDARAAGMILLKAMEETGFSLEDWITRCSQPLTPQGPITREGNPEGPLSGEVAVFTGALSMPRRKAADLAARAGCAVDGGVTKDTTLLIVGDQDVTRLASGRSKSSKHLKAETMIAKGQAIRVLRESDFLQLVR